MAWPLKTLLLLLLLVGRTVYVHCALGALTTYAYGVIPCDERAYLFLLSDEENTLVCIDHQTIKVITNTTATLIHTFDSSNLIVSYDMDHQGVFYWFSFSQEAYLVHRYNVTAHLPLPDLEPAFAVPTSDQSLQLTVTPDGTFVYVQTPTSIARIAVDTNVITYLPTPYSYGRANRLLFMFLNGTVPCLYIHPQDGVTTGYGRIVDAVSGMLIISARHGGSFPVNTQLYAFPNWNRTRIFFGDGAGTSPVVVMHLLTPIPAPFESFLVYSKIWCRVLSSAQIALWDGTVGQGTNPWGVSGTAGCSGLLGFAESSSGRMVMTQDHNDAIYTRIYCPNGLDTDDDEGGYRYDKCKCGLAYPNAPTIVSPTRESTCDQCPTSYGWMNATSLGCVPCPLGTAALYQCSQCAIGKYGSNPPATSCTACSAGYGTLEAGQTVCARCSVGRSSPDGICSECGPGTFSNVEAQTACTSCLSGTWTPFPGRTVCQACGFGNYTTDGGTQCVPCPVGRWVHSALITACHECSPGFYSNVESALQCTGCLPGSWSMREGSSSCEPCAAGKYQAHANSSVCDPCPVGFFSNQTGMSMCLACPSGTFAGSTNRTSCFGCGSGSYQNASATSFCWACAFGFFSNSDSNLECLACPIGKYTGSLGSSACHFCEAGFISTSIAATVCMACEAGTYAFNSSLCHDCVPGRSTDNQDAQTTCATCIFGKAQSESRARQCIPCLEGFFALSPGATTCSVCPAGHQLPSSALCIPCPAGRFVSPSSVLNGNNGFCSPCSPGTYANASAATTCVQCPGNTFSGDYGATTCSSCPSTTFAEPGSSQCGDCPAGSQLTLETCSLCPVGKYSKQAGSSVCVPCDWGTYASNQGSTTCVTCPQGQYALSSSLCSLCLPGTFGGGSSACLPCFNGTFAALPGSSACASCSIGFFAPQEGAMSCLQCPAGSYSIPGEASRCFSCPMGRYGTLEDYECHLCPMGSYSSRSGQTTCEACATATSCPLGSSLPSLSLASLALLQQKLGDSSQGGVVDASVAPVAKRDPLSTLMADNNTHARRIQLGVGLSALVIIVIASSAYVCFRRRPGVKQTLRTCDLLYDTDHWVVDGLPLHRRSRALGGLFTIIAFGLMCTFVMIALVEYELVPTFIERLAPISSLPFQPFGLINATVVLIGTPPDACNENFSSVHASSSSVSTSNGGNHQIYSQAETRYSDDGCVLSWTCTACGLDFDQLILSFHTVSYAAAIVWHVELPGYSTAPSTRALTDATESFYISSGLLPSVPMQQVLFGDSSNVQLSILPVVVVQSNSGITKVGTMASLTHSLKGSQVNETKMSSASDGGKASIFNLRMDVANTVYKIEATNVSWIILLAQLGSLMGTVIALGRLMMNVFERRYPCSGCSGCSCVGVKRDIVILLSYMYQSCCSKKTLKANIPLTTTTTTLTTTTNDVLVL